LVIHSCSLKIAELVQAVQEVNLPNQEEGGEGREGEVIVLRSNNVAVVGGHWISIAQPFIGARGRPGSNSDSELSRFADQQIPPSCRLHRNIPRLTHYIEEANTGRG